MAARKLNITRMMTIANGMCVSYCNQPKAQFGYFSHAGMSLPSPVLRVEAFGYLKRVKGTFWSPLGTPLGQSR